MKHAGGPLPGGCEVRRRAKALREAMSAKPGDEQREPLRVLKFHFG